MIACTTEATTVGRVTDGIGLNRRIMGVSDTEITPLVRFRVTPGSALGLRSVDPEYHGAYPTRESAIPEARFYAHKIDELQYVMHAEKKHSLLIVLQGIDAGGKDGVVRHLLTAMNPAGCSVIGFKQPSTVELGHDFLWRVHAHAPMKGGVVIFNRSHYEDVLTVRVNRLVPQNLWSKRYDLINDFERLLVTDNNTTILKFFLHISKAEQLARFKQRLEDPSRRWKISECDYRERTHWRDYMDAFEEMLARTSTPEAPWFIIPGNHRWYRDLAVAQIIAQTLEQLDMKLPEPSVDMARIRHQYYTAEKNAKQEQHVP
jgi:PPK2 family polyphosphate:nucleotide phosphotransferase